jgi:hypothetical protein
MATLSPSQTLTKPSQTLAAFAVPTTDGRTVDVVPRWRGRALAVHPPINDGASPVSRGVWAITHPVSGLRAGTFRGTLKRAVALARVWDGAFAAALANQTAPLSLADWPQRTAWLRQCDGTLPVVGPVPSDHPDFKVTHQRNGAPTLPTLSTLPPIVADDNDGAGDQFPATTTIIPTTPGRARFARTLPNGRARLRNPETGKPVRMNGDCAAFRNPANPMVPTLKLWFGGVWHDVPTTDQCMAWSLDGVCETPDGRMVECDAPDAWLSLLGVV